MKNGTIAQFYHEWKSPGICPRRAEVLAQRIATTTATNITDLRCQIMWLNKDLGYELIEGVSAPYLHVLDIIQAGVDEVAKVEA